MEKSLHGQVTIVTGVSRSQGIGASIGRKIAPLGSHLFLTGWPEYDQNEHSDSELKGLLREFRMAGSRISWLALSAPYFFPTRLAALFVLSVRTVLPG